MKSQNAVSKTWETKRRRMNPYRMAITLMVVLCLAIAVIVTVTALVLANQAEASSLPDSLQMQVLQLEAAGNFVAADNLKRQMQAQIQLAARQKAAQDSLAARQKTAQAELARKQLEARHKAYAEWEKQVKPMPIDSVWTWCNSKDKAIWLAVRYGFQYDHQSHWEDQAANMAAEMQARKKLRTEVSRQMGGLTGKVEKLAKRVDVCERDIAAVRTAVMENGFDIKAALSVLESANNKETVDAARQKARQK